MNRRWIVLVAAGLIFEWLLITAAMLMDGSPYGPAPAIAAALVIVGNGSAALVIAAMEWAMRGDR